jgi:phosphoglycerol transferase MdoB-like AlkP superfamily enzyme
MRYSDVLIFFAGLQLKGNIYKALLLRLALAMVLFSICRIGFYLYNRELFTGIGFGYFMALLLAGLRFDLTAVIYTNLLFILLMIIPLEVRFKNGYQSVCQWVFLVFNGIALAANVSDFIYYPFTGRRTTADVFQQFENENNFAGLILRFLLDYWHALLFWMVLIALMYWVYRKITVAGPQLKNKITFYVAGVLILPIIIGLLIAGVRGGFLHSTRPITLNDAGQYVKDPSHASLVLNTPFAIYRTLRTAKIQKVNYFSSEDELSDVFDPIHPADTSRKMKKLNVVIIILESFSREFVGYFNKEREGGTYKGYTPFFDSLASQSKTFDYSLANGRKSIDALPSIIASIPSMGVPYVLTPFSGNRINSLGNILQREGYHTSFFHGAPNGSMGFSSFMNIAGVEHYYGMDEYHNKDDYDGLWGIWDEKYFKFWASSQKEFPQPFFSALFSVSSHHPFKIPQEYESMFKGGREPILKCIQYTDFALKKYFEEVSKQAWYANTLFVIVADHVSSNVLFPDGHSSPGRYSIPILFFRPDMSLAAKETAIVSQVDIMPSVLGYLEYPKDYLTFGRDVFHTPSDEAFAWNYNDNLHHLYFQDYLLKFDGQKSVGLYNYKQDTLERKNLLQQYTEVARGMEKKMKAIIQQYNNRMSANKLVP